MSLSLKYYICKCSAFNYTRVWIDSCNVRAWRSLYIYPTVFSIMSNSRRDTKSASHGTNEINRWIFVIFRNSTDGEKQQQKKIETTNSMNTSFTVVWNQIFTSLNIEQNINTNLKNRKLKNNLFLHRKRLEDQFFLANFQLRFWDYQRSYYSFSYLIRGFYTFT